MNLNVDPRIPVRTLFSSAIRGYYALMAASTFVIAMLTLFPFRFEQFDRIGSFYIYYDGLLFGGYSPCCLYLSVLEPLANVLLFVPFGFALTGIFRVYGWAWTAVLPAVLVLSTLLTCSVEFLQVFQPARSPSLTDIVMNTIGGGLGIAAYRLSARLLHERFSTTGASPLNAS